MSSNGNSQAIQYTIQPGDTLWDLANQYNTSVDEIIAANPGLDPDNLMVGQVIVIPDPPQRAPERRPEYRRPERGREFHRAPYFRPPYYYYRRPYFRPPYYPPYPYPYPYAPPVAACPAGTTPYTVQPGDTLYTISARYGISLDALIAANPSVNFNALYVGQVICLPIG